MSDYIQAIALVPHRLASVFDQFPPGTPLSLDDLERAMSRDTERRCLTALDRALARLAAPTLSTLPSPGPDRIPDRPDGPLPW